MAKGMVLVGRLGRGPDAGVGEDAGRKIQKGMGRVGEDRDTAGQQADQQLGPDQHDVHEDRVEGRAGLRIGPDRARRLRVLHGEHYM